MDIDEKLTVPEHQLPITFTGTLTLPPGCVIIPYDLYTSSVNINNTLWPLLATEDNKELQDFLYKQAPSLEDDPDEASTEEDEYEKRDAQLGRDLCDILSKHVSETGKCESAVEVLNRIIADRDALRKHVALYEETVGPLFEYDHYR